MRSTGVHLIFFFVKIAQSNYFKLLHFFWAFVLQKMSGFDRIRIYLKMNLGGAEK
jgi:hypothetical protein